MFRHDRLTRGICMDWCRAKMKKMSSRTRQSYYLDSFLNETDIYKDPNFHSHALIDRGRYYRYATECVNYELKNEYGLMAQSQIRYCVTNKDNNAFGWLSLRIRISLNSNNYMLFFCYLCRLAWLVVCGTMRNDWYFNCNFNELRFSLET